MRRLLRCVPMTILLLLSACGAGRTGVNEAERLSIEIRSEYQSLAAWSAQAEVTADYGQRVYAFQMAVEGEGEDLTMTLLGPATVAGLTARVKGENSLLEYDELSVETGPLDGAGLTPVSAVPALMAAARSGYIAVCSMDGEQLRLDCGDPERQPGAGTETSLWFDAETHALSRGEISVDGARRIICEFSDFNFIKE